MCKTFTAKSFCTKGIALTYSYKIVLPVAQATLNKRVICSAGNLVKGNNTTLHLFYA